MFINFSLRLVRFILNMLSNKPCLPIFLCAAHLGSDTGRLLSSSILSWITASWISWGVHSNVLIMWLVSWMKFEHVTTLSRYDFWMQYSKIEHHITPILQENYSKIVIILKQFSLKTATTRRLWRIVALSVKNYIALVSLICTYAKTESYFICQQTHKQQVCTDIHYHAIFWMSYKGRFYCSIGITGRYLEWNVNCFL